MVQERSWRLAAGTACNLIYTAGLAYPPAPLPAQNLGAPGASLQVGVKVGIKRESSERGTKELLDCRCLGDSMCPDSRNVKITKFSSFIWAVE